MEFKDYYQTLGVDRQAGSDEIKKAFRRLARKYHPDVSKEPDAEARMKEVNEAFAVLSDPEKRAAYDRLGPNHHAGDNFRPPPGWDTGFDFSDAEAAGFSDFFSELFGGHPGRAGRHGRHSGHFRGRGQDSHARIELDLEDSYQGAIRSITVGWPGAPERSLNVRIPRGVAEGQVIRLAGQGSPGRGNGPSGDLYLEVHFKPHRRYRIEGRDVYAGLPVAPWEAALGAAIKAPLPDGEVEVRIPEGSQGGRKLRLKGRGIPGTPPGDLYLVLEVVLPSASDPKARRLYQDMARELAFNPRRDLGL